MTIDPTTGLPYRLSAGGNPNFREGGGFQGYGVDPPPGIMGSPGLSPGGQLPPGFSWNGNQIVRPDSPVQMGDPYSMTTFDDNNTPNTSYGNWDRIPGPISNTFGDAQPGSVGWLTETGIGIGGGAVLSGLGAAGGVGGDAGAAAGGPGEAGSAGLGGDTGLYGSGVDEFGNPTQGNFQGGPGSPGTGPGDVPYPGDPSSGFPKIPGLPGGGGGGGGGPGGLPSWLTGGGGPSLGSMIPPGLALAYASGQKPIDTSRLVDTYNAAGANAPAFVNAAIAPAQRAQATGYGDILQSQGQRGIRGSSFGDTLISDFLSKSNENIGNVGASAAAQALGLQGGLAGNIAQLNAQSQQMKNDLYGRAFDLFGRSLNPGAYNPSINIGGMPGMPTPGAPSSPGMNIPPWMRQAGNSIGNWFGGGGDSSPSIDFSSYAG